MERNTLLDISPFLYDMECSNVPEILDRYIEMLKHSGNVIDAQNATVQQQYRKMVTNTRFLSQVRTHFNSLYKELSRMGLYFKLDGRRKSLFSFEKKVQLAIESEQPLDSIRDIFAFRIVLFDTQDDALIEECYKVMESLTLFLSQNGFIPCEATKCVSTRSRFIKDYIQNPKDSGYQSLHAIFFHPATGHYFEVQIRTLSMHAIAEKGSAAHMNYKKNKYSCEALYDGIDLAKVHLRGFWYQDEMFLDEIGVINSINILTRQRTF
ncbi:MAG: hypothetical protein J6K42_07385 [Clostridia bacterium]|nr:hypothetical protein [Clostridia bacterium]